MRLTEGDIANHPGLVMTRHVAGEFKLPGLIKCPDDFG